MCFAKWPYLMCCMCYIRWDFSSALAAVLLSLSEKPKRDFTRSDEWHFNFLALCSVLSYRSLSLCFSLYPLNLTESLIIPGVLCYLFPPWCSTSQTIWGQELQFVHLFLFVFSSFASKARVYSENDLFVTTMQERIKNISKWLFSIIIIIKK